MRDKKFLRFLPLKMIWRGEVGGGGGALKHIKHLEEASPVEKIIYLILTKGSTFLTIIIAVK